jgi:hypothetical protein
MIDIEKETDRKAEGFNLAGSARRGHAGKAK